MTRPNITPGEWRQASLAEGDEYTCRILAGTGVHQMLVAKTHMRDDGRFDYVEAEANARAIAAVPALLEALEKTVIGISITDHGDGYVEIPREDYQAMITALTAAGYQF